jgi:hypothetical protein
MCDSDYDCESVPYIPGVMLGTQAIGAESVSFVSNAGILL